MGCTLLVLRQPAPSFRVQVQSHFINTAQDPLVSSLSKLRVLGTLCQAQDKRPNFLIINHSITAQSDPSRCLPCRCPGSLWSKDRGGVGACFWLRIRPGSAGSWTPSLISPARLLFRILSFPVVWLSLPSSCCPSPGWGTVFPQHSSPSQKHGMEPASVGCWQGHLLRRSRAGSGPWVRVSS